MTSPNDELLERILKDEPPASSKTDQLRAAVTQWSQGQRNVTLAVMTLLVVFSGTLMMVGIYLLARAQDTRLMIIGLAAVLLGISLNALERVRYYVIENKISVLKELRLFHLGMLERFAPEDTNGTVADEAQLERLLPTGLPTKRGWFWERIPHKTARQISMAILVTCGVVSGVIVGYATYGAATHWFPKAGITQGDEWHVTASGEIAARSRIMLRHRGVAPFITIALPYATGQIKSVSSDGKPLRYTQLDWRRYEVETSVGEFGTSVFDVLVEWTFPMDALLQVDNGYRTKLNSLLDVDHYRLEIVLDPGCGFEMIDSPGQSRFQTFSMSGRPPRTFFGSTSLTIRKVGEDAGLQ